MSLLDWLAVYGVVFIAFSIVLSIIAERKGNYDTVENVMLMMMVSIAWPLVIVYVIVYIITTLVGRK